MMVISDIVHQNYLSLPHSKHRVECHCLAPLVGSTGESLVEMLSLLGYSILGFYIYSQFAFLKSSLFFCYGDKDI